MARLTPSLDIRNPENNSLEDPLPLSLDSIDRARQRQSSVLASATGATPSPRDDDTPPPDPSASPQDLEEEAAAEGAFNPETGEINWDCPCLGGMAHGPCGEQFKEAFSCFVFSKEEPKGMDCIDNFKNMQDCFREHPDVYKGELEDDEDMDDEDRADLQREVEERRALAEKVREREESERPQKRLLEEAPAPPRPAKSTAKETKPVPPAQTAPTPPATPPPPPSTPQKQTQTLPPPPPPPSSEPHPGMSENHAAEREKVEMMSASAPSKTLTERRPPPVQDRHPDAKAEVFDEDLALMPKAWHDGRDAAVPAQEKEKEKR